MVLVSLRVTTKTLVRPIISSPSQSLTRLIALKHHTSKLETFSDLTSVRTFGFRGEALSSLCAMSEQVTVNTATSATSPLGVSLDMDSHGRIKKRSSVARQVCLIFFCFRILASFSDRHDSHFDQPLHLTTSTKEGIRKKCQARIWKGSFFAQRLCFRALFGRFWGPPNCQQST